MNEKNTVYDIDFTRSLPAPLKNDANMLALGKVIAGELRENIRLARQCSIYARINELDETVLDILARDLHVDWYDDSYPIAVKRQIIKDSVRVHKRLGTKYAVETALKAVCPQIRVREWFEYGGKPFNFRIEILRAGTDIPVDVQKISEAARFYKRLSVHLDGIYFTYNTHFDLSKLTHEQLSKYTHHQLRHEEILVPEPPKPPEPPEPPDFTAPTLSVNSGTYFMSITVYVIRPEGYENMKVYYYLDGDDSNMTRYDGDEPFTFTSSHTISLLGRVDNKTTAVNTYTYIIEQPHFAETMKLDSVKMSDSVSFEMGDTVNVNLDAGSIEFENTGLSDTINFNFI